MAELAFTRNIITLYDGTAAGNGNWVDLDTKYLNVYNALYSVSLESGDWCQVQLRLEKSDRAPVFTQNTVSATPTAPQALDAPAAQIRVVKTGTAGNCRVVLYG